MRIAFITTDHRDDHRRYSDAEPSFGAAPTAVLQGFAGLSGCEVHVISCVQQPVRSPVHTFGTLFYHSVVVGKQGWLRGAYLGCILGIRRTLQAIQPDIVHGQGTERYCSLAAVFSGYPNVLTIHGNMRQVARAMQARPFGFHWLTAHLERIALARTGGVFCNSEYTKRMVQPNTAKTWQVPNALRQEFFGPVVNKGHQEPPLLLNLGTVIPYKNQIRILAVCRRLYERGFKFEMRFAGGIDPTTSYGTEFLCEIRKAEECGYARYVGFLNGSALIDTLDAAKGLVHFPTEEAFGLVVAEALARNLKFFGSRTGGVPDIAEGVSDAELFGPDDWEELEAAIASWLSAGAVRSVSASDSIQSRYLPKTIARRHLDIYSEVLRDSNVNDESRAFGGQ